MAKRKDRDDAPDSDVPGSERPDEDAESAKAEFDEPSDEEKRDESPRVTRAELRVFIGKPATYARARSIIAQKMKKQDVDDLVGEAIAEALETQEVNLPRVASIQAWFDRICRRRVAKRYVKVAQDPGDAMKEVDPRVEPHPIANDWRAEGWLLRRWMRQEFASDPRDRETWAIMEELAQAEEDEKLSYKKLAERHGMTEAQLYKRMERLREKYRRRYEQWRNGMVVALLKWGAGAVVAGVAIAWIVWKLLQPTPPAEIRPDPEEERPVPSASASAAPPFEPALPTQPPAPPKPQKPDKPAQ
jgi:hypothetical protein